MPIYNELNISVKFFTLGLETQLQTESSKWLRNQIYEV